MSTITEDYLVRPAIAITQRNPKPFYAFSLRASELRKIAYVSERTKNNPEKGIQRNLNLSRCKKIGKYIKSKMATFPNSIIIALDKNSRFEPGKAEGVGKIYIPNKAGQALILDGQHRLYGFDFASNKDLDLLIVAFISIPTSFKAHIFRMINGEQKPVNKSLLYDLLDLDTSTAEFEEERTHALVKELDRDEESPFYRNVQMTGAREEGFISQASLVTYLKPLFKKDGLFRKYEYLPFNKQYELLNCYFSSIRDTFPSDWGNPKSILSKTSGISAFMRLLPDLVQSIEEEGEKVSYRTFRDLFENLLDFPLDVETHKLYGTGGAIELHKVLRERVGLDKKGS